MLIILNYRFYVGLPSSLVEAEERRRKSSESSMSGGKFYASKSWLSDFLNNLAYLKSFNNDLHCFLQEIHRKEVLLLHLLLDPLVAETYLPVWEECCLLQVVRFLEVTSYIKG